MEECTYPELLDDLTWLMALFCGGKLHTGGHTVHGDTRNPSKRSIVDWFQSGGRSRRSELVTNAGVLLKQYPT